MDIGVIYMVIWVVMRRSVSLSNHLVSILHCQCRPMDKRSLVGGEEEQGRTPYSPIFPSALQKKGTSDRSPLRPQRNAGQNFAN